MGCQSKETPKRERPIVLVTLAPYAAVVKALAFDLVQVETLIPAGANPHLYEAPPQLVAKHQGAALWLYVGESFDKRMLQFLKESGSSIRTVNLAQGVDLIGECHCHHYHQDSQDLHIWMSPIIVESQVHTIAAALKEIVPTAAVLLEEREQALSHKLQQMHQSIAERLQVKQDRVLLVSHPAFAYFCREYGIEQLSIEVEGKEPKPFDLQQLIEQAQAKGAHVIITEPQHSSKGAEALSRLLHLPIQEVDPYAEDYFNTLEQLTSLISYDK